jgi:carbon monoxide dehydrogenase subunit G
MRTVTGRIEIARPVEEVFDFVADERNEPRYNKQMLSFEKPVRLASWSHIAGTMDIRGAVTFEAIPNGTLMSWRWDLEPHGCVKLLGPMVTRIGRRQEERIWTSLKTLLEGEPKPASANA